MVDGLGSRFREAAQLHDVGVALMRKNLVRRHPELDDEGIDGLLLAWLLDRPPDAPGTTRSQPSDPAG